MPVRAEGMHPGGMHGGMGTSFAGSVQGAGYGMGGGQFGGGGVGVQAPVAQRGEVQTEERAGVAAVVVIGFEGIAVVAVEAILRTKPHEALAVLVNSVNGVVG